MASNTNNEVDEETLLQTEDNLAPILTWYLLALVPMCPSMVSTLILLSGPGKHI